MISTKFSLSLISMVAWNVCMYIYFDVWIKNKHLSDTFLKILNIYCFAIQIICGMFTISLIIMVFHGSFSLSFSRHLLSIFDFILLIFSVTKSYKRLHRAFQSAIYLYVKLTLLFRFSETLLWLSNRTHSTHTHIYNFIEEHFRSERIFDCILR